MIQLLITSSGSGGEGVARHEGKAVFVPGALPGEVVSAEIMGGGDGYFKARLTGVIKPSPERRKPACPHYGMCGGCGTQHMSYALELDIKSKAVAGALRHIGGIQPEEYELLPAIPCPESGKKRNKAVYHVESGLNVICGFNSPKSREIVDICGENGCMMQSAQSNAALSALREWLRGNPAARIDSLMTRTSRDGSLFLAVMAGNLGDAHSKSLCAALRRALPSLCGVVLCKPLKHSDAPGETVKILLGDGYARDEILGCRFRLCAQSFFQVNAAQSDALYKAAMSLGEISGADVLDAYCGAGTLSVVMAKNGAKSVTGVEISQDMVMDARHNAQMNGCLNCSFHAGAAERILPELAASRRFEAVTLDPPRKGLDYAALKSAADMAGERIVYISCNPATLARDAKLLRQIGWRLAAAEPVDMFPGTAHIESAALFRRS